MNILLIGFDNSNKDEIAEILANRLSYDLLLFNSLITSISGRKSIQEIIQKDGELTRSRLETQILSELELKDNFIISASENIIFNQINILTLKKDAKTIYLKDFKYRQESLLEKQKLMSLKDQLFKFYSDAFIEIENETPNQISLNILEFLKNDKNIKII